MNQEPPRPEVGSVADEAAKLFGALGERLREHQTDGDAADRTDHAQHTPETCRWCPLCQAVGFLRDTSPEVRAQVVSSAGALVLALRHLLDEAGRAPADEAAGRTDDGVEHIDLTDTAEGEEPWA